MKVPLAVGVPLTVTVLLDQSPVTPAGNPVTVAPVAPVVVYVIEGMAELTTTVGLFVPVPELRLMVLLLAMLTVVAEDAVEQVAELETTTE